MEYDLDTSIWKRVPWNHWEIPSDKSVTHVPSRTLNI